MSRVGIMQQETAGRVQRILIYRKINMTIPINSKLTSKNQINFPLKL